MKENIEHLPFLREQETKLRRDFTSQFPRPVTETLEFAQRRRALVNLIQIFEERKEQESALSSQEG